MEVSLNKQQCSLQIACSDELSPITLIKHLFTKQSLGSLVMFLITHTYISFSIRTAHSASWNGHKPEGNQVMLQSLIKALKQNLLS